MAIKLWDQEMKRCRSLSLGPGPCVVRSVCRGKVSQAVYSRILLFGPLKFKAVFVAKCFVIYCQVFLTFLASKSIKLSFTSNIVY